MAVADRLLAPGMGRDALDGEIDFDEALRILLGHSAFQFPRILATIKDGLRFHQDSARSSRSAANRAAPGRELP